ncbi:MAG: RagB/SusD family nutrient uptake outer membrane protein [Ginsengibacter sp.]
MKRYQLIFCLASAIFMTLAGCTKKLDVQPLDQITSAAVWQDVSLMQAYVNDVYRGIGYGEFNSTSGMSVMTDEAIWTNGAKPIVQSTITSSNLDIIGGSRFSYLVWGTLYSYIRSCNMFLQNTRNSSVTPQAQLDRLKGEMHFLRSYYYHNLMRVNGGVPIITKVYGLNDSTAKARNTFAETIDFIVKDADSAAALLPLSYTGADVGRVTKGAALALKARVLLYAASDLYNVNPAGKPEFGYTDGGVRQMGRWQAAKDAAKAVMDMGIYELYGANPAPGDSTAKTYSDLFLSKTNKEIIMNRFTSVNNKAPNVAMWFSPNGYDGYGENSPIQQMVDSYRMKDGSKFSWDNSEEAAHPYENRDPRFYASVFYDGAHWRERWSDGKPFDPVGIIQAFKTLTLPDGSELAGIDTRNGPVQSWNGSYSNYYLRKFVDPTNNLLSQSQEIPWPFFRYAEILLNYAEASIELGMEGDARDVLNQIRRRAGMPEFQASLTGSALQEEYRNERKIEMAFEEQRFFDIRRWMIAPQVMNEDAQGIEISVKGTDRADRSTYHDYKYKVIDIQPRHWDDKMYFIPISFDEMKRNPKLIQAPGF